MEKDKISETIFDLDYIKELTEINKKKIDQDSKDLGAIWVFNGYVLDAARRGATNNLVDKAYLSNNVINVAKEKGFKLLDTTDSRHREYVIIDWTD